MRRQSQNGGFVRLGTEAFLGTSGMLCCEKETPPRRIPPVSADAAATAVAVPRERSKTTEEKTTTVSNNRHCIRLPVAQAVEITRMETIASPAP
jgi:hypothetical protein